MGNQRSKQSILLGVLVVLGCGCNAIFALDELRYEPRTAVPTVDEDAEAGPPDAASDGADGSATGDATDDTASDAGPDASDAADAADTLDPG